MLPSERKRRILAILKERREIPVGALAQMLEEPAANVRRDLRELEAESRILRRHGLAVYRATLVAAATIEDEPELEPALLDELVDETVYILAEARNLFLTGGPVLARAARKLSGKTIATHDLGLAMAAAAGDNDVSLVGREVDNRTLTLRSPGFDKELAQYWFDAAVFEVEGVDEKNLWVARKNHSFLPALMARADTFVAVAKSTALGRKGDRVAGPLTQADVLIIDKGASPEARRALHDVGIELRVAGERELGGFADKLGNVFAFKRGPGRFGQAAAAAAEPQAVELDGLDAEPGPGLPPDD